MYQHTHTKKKTDAKRSVLFLRAATCADPPAWVDPFRKKKCSHYTWFDHARASPPLLMPPSSLDGIAGLYYDPKHGGCLRRVRAPTWAERRCGADAVVLGVYGTDEARHGLPWTATLSFRGPASAARPLSVDFGGKEERTHARAFSATWWPARGAIVWQDGNTWRKLPFHRSQL